MLGALELSHRSFYASVHNQSHFKPCGISGWQHSSCREVNISISANP
jgi:hypothetical protein